jgi:hypothetical protein
MRDVRGSLAREDGVAMVVATAMMFVLSMLAAVFLSTAMQSASDATGDRNAKRALGAAEAGLQVAALRLNSVDLAANACLAGAPSGNECPTGTTGNVGDGATYTYYVSQRLGPGVGCATLPGYVPTASERCVTSVGTVGGVARRIQARVAKPQAAPLFGTAGVVGEDWVYVGNSNKLNTPVGSNGVISLVNSNELYGPLLLPPGASYTGNPDQLKASPKTQSMASPFDLAEPPWPTPVPPSAGNPYDNSALSTTYYQADPPGGPKRKFSMASAATYRMPAGTYNFCDFSLGNSVKLTVAGPVKIYIDSPARPGSDCASGGRFVIMNSVEMNNDGDATDFQVFVWGTRNEAANASITCPAGTWKYDVVVCNSAPFAATIYAADSGIRFDNSVQFKGALAAKNVSFGNSVTFDWPNSVKSIPGFASGGHKRKVWVECKSKQPAAGDPESGC